METTGTVTPAARKQRRRLLERNIPDPVQAHGAWVYLVVSILAGALSCVRAGALPAVLAGVGFAGVFLAAGAFGTRDQKRRLKRLVIGGLLATAAPLGAISLGSDAWFLVYGLVAILPAAIAGYFGERTGFRSSLALAFAVTALVVAAPSSACAGGATPLRSWLLLLLLAPFFAWRIACTRRVIVEQTGWTRKRLRQQGWREAAWALLWTTVSVLVIHLVD
jgi:hypothetical protein